MAFLGAHVLAMAPVAVLGLLGCEDNALQDAVIDDPAELIGAGRLPEEAAGLGPLQVAYNKDGAASYFCSMPDVGQPPVTSPNDVCAWLHFSDAPEWFEKASSQRSGCGMTSATVGLDLFVTNAGQVCGQYETAESEFN